MRKVLILILVLSFFGIGCQKQEVIEETVISKEETDSKVDIINLNSKSRPYAVVINNSTAAVKVQTGLQEAYLTYEIPVEGGLTRLLAFYKDKHDIKIGTIRSARHNFLDYVFENDAIFICYGWSHYAKDDMTSINLDYMNGVVHSGSFWRENPENLASEHTAYTSLAKVIEFSKNKNFTLTTEKGNVFQYSPIDIDLSHNVEVSKANTIRIPSNDFSNTTYVYDEENKIYKRFVNNEPNIDYETKKQFTTKNIIVQKINTKMAKDNYYWDLETVGSGTGFFITNGYAIPILWKKDARTEKTCYTYLDGTVVTLSDGNTFVQLQSVKQKLTIEG